MASQTETDQQLVWRSQQPLGALVGDVPDDEQLWILGIDGTNLVGFDREQREKIWQARQALGRVIELRAGNDPQVAWDHDGMLSWAAFTQDREPLTVEITLERAAGGVRATIESRHYGPSF